MAGLIRLLVAPCDWPRGELGVLISAWSAFLFSRVALFSLDDWTFCHSTSSSDSVEPVVKPVGLVLKDTFITPPGWTMAGMLLTVAVGSACIRKEREALAAWLAAAAAALSPSFMSPGGSDSWKRRGSTVYLG